jgi:ammonia channel protein AmtB
MKTKILSILTGIISIFILSEYIFYDPNTILTTTGIPISVITVSTLTVTFLLISSLSLYWFFYKRITPIQVIDGIMIGFLTSFPILKISGPILAILLGSMGGILLFIINKKLTKVVMNK